MPNQLGKLKFTIKEMTIEEEDGTISNVQVDGVLNVNVTDPTPDGPLLLKTDGLDLTNPRWQATKPNDVRGWFYPSVVYAHSRDHLFGSVDRPDGRHLYYSDGTEDSNRVPLKKNVEQVTAWTQDNRVHLSGIGKRVNGSFYHFLGSAGWNGQDKLFGWVFEEQPDPYTGPFPTGDIHAFADDQIWIKGNEFVHNNAGDLVDYRRHWFAETDPVTFAFPPVTGNVQRWDVYSMSILVPANEGWDSRSLYVGLVGLFGITDNPMSAWQHGNIDIVWVESDDGVTWTFPWGSQPCLPRDGTSAKMLNPGFNMFRWGPDTLRIPFGVTHYEHNTYNQNNALHVTGGGEATVSRAAFEKAFGA